jgi:hypothetical protein
MEFLRTSLATGYAWLRAQVETSAPKLAAWVLVGTVVVLGIGVFMYRHAPQDTPPLVPVTARNVSIIVTPTTVKTGATTSITVTARDGEGATVNAWEGARLEAWLVRNDLAYATHIDVPASAATSTLEISVAPTDPGSYRLVVQGTRSNVVTIGGAVLSVTGRSTDTPPAEQSSGRAGFKVAAATMPEAEAITANQTVAITYVVSRTGTPIALTDRSGGRGVIAAFREGGGQYVYGESVPAPLQPSPAASAFTITFPEAGRYKLYFEYEVNGQRYMESRWIAVKAEKQ